MLTKIITVFLFFLSFFLGVTYSYAEIGRSIGEFEQSRFIETYDPEKKGNKTLHTGNEAYLYIHNKSGAMMEVILDDENKIEKQTMLGFYNAPMDTRMAFAGILVAYVFEASGGKIKPDEFNSMLAKAREKEEEKTELAGFDIDIKFLPELEGVRMLTVAISKPE